jgi:hypothetical protein
LDTKLRNQHAFLLFDLVNSLELRNGASINKAKHAALEAVEMRYGITCKTLQNYMTRERSAGDADPTFFELENIDFARKLEETNRSIREKISGLQSMLAKNEHLLELLHSIDANIH